MVNDPLMDNEMLRIKKVQETYIEQDKRFQELV